MVALRDARARVGGRTVWSHVTLTIGRASSSRCSGRTGPGKSTLLKALMGLLPADGEISVLGVAPAGAARSGSATCRSGGPSTPQTRIRGIDIVRLGLDGDRWGTPVPLLCRLLRPAAYRQARRRVAEVIDLVGAGAYAHRPIGQLSGGEQQRLLIAQALVRGPELLLLDEPLESLDVSSQASVSALVQRICRTRNVTVLMVAHDVNPILPYLDKVIYLAHGGAVIGPPAEVITADTLSMLYDTPITVVRDRTGRLCVVGQPDLHPVHQPVPGELGMGG